MVSVCLPSDALLQHLLSYLGFSYLGCGVSLHGCSSKAQPLLLTVDEGYLLTAVPPDLECGVAPLGPPAPAQPALSNSMKLWAMPCRVTQDGQVMVESSDKTWSIGEGNGKPLQYSCLENPMNSMKRQKDRILKDELPRSVGAQYAYDTNCRWKNISRKSEDMEPKQKHHLWMWLVMEARSEAIKITTA